MKDIDQMVEDWHNGAGEGLELHEYLGMSWEEYKEQCALIPQSLFEKMKHIRELAEISKKREKLEAASKAYAQAKREGTIKTLDIPVRDNEKKSTPTVSKIDLQVDTQILEDGSLWMRTKLDIEEEWGEWGLV
ncbi:MAG: hypothetical protein Tp178MES00d2C33159851_17 [Prokaryotic dsDNA virus sp.]|nr:MAG: hypothetical protein Tp178MES00d2C33159851_17 [Prokaryotic dsDNA virus sp.]|tara:strand:- start:86958 stop:87356 length:399 start_codon:yes stop_codon:yes gene_type:complete